MKLKRIIIFSIIVLCLLLNGCANKKSSHEITIYADFKCPYCQNFENKTMPLIKEKMHGKKLQYKFINVGFLGKDSLKSAHALNAIKIYAPKQEQNFVESLFKVAQRNKNIKESNIDKEIRNLKISEATKDTIIKDYKTKNSKSQNKTKEDQKNIKNKKIESVPTVYWDGVEVKNINDINSYKI